MAAARACASANWAAAERGVVTAARATADGLVTPVLSCFFMSWVPSLEKQTQIVSLGHGTQQHSVAADPAGPSAPNIWAMSEEYEVSDFGKLLGINDPLGVEDAGCR
jgi:hypothetical protein